MVIFNVSEKWSIGIPRTLTQIGFDPKDPNVEFRAGQRNRKLVIDGNGNATISGNRARIYCHYKNYNSILTLTLIPNFIDEEEDDCSLKLRSRHNEPTDKEECEDGRPFDGNRFGGYGFSVQTKKWVSKREPTHNCHDQAKRDKFPDNKTLENGKEYKLRFTVKDDGNKVRQIGEIDFNESIGFVRVMNRFDDSPKSWMIKRSLYEEKSYLWIRNNSADGSITVKDVTLEVLP